MSESWTAAQYRHYLDTGEAPDIRPVPTPARAPAPVPEAPESPVHAPRAKQPHRQLAGKMAQSRGKSFEAEINMANAEYARLGMARIEQLPVATQPMPRTWIDREHQKKSGICRILAERAPFDYYGTIGEIGARPTLNRGRAIAMECKHTAEHKTRLPVGDKRTLKAHQLHACADAWHRFGTIVAIVWRNGEQRGVLGPNKILDYSQRLRLGEIKSIPWSDFIPYPIKRIEKHGITIEHWMSPIIAWININLR